MSDMVRVVGQQRRTGVPEPWGLVGTVELGTPDLAVMRDVLANQPG